MHKSHSVCPLPTFLTHLGGNAISNQFIVKRIRLQSTGDDGQGRGGDDYDNDGDDYDEDDGGDDDSDDYDDIVVADAAAAGDKDGDDYDEDAGFEDGGSGVIGGGGHGGLGDRRY